MTQYDNTDRGALFVNRDKQTDNHPDLTGSLNVGGVDFWVSAWKKESKGGQKYLSLSIKPKEQRSVRGTAPIASEPDFDDPIPF